MQRFFFFLVLALFISNSVEAFAQEERQTIRHIERADIFFERAGIEESVKERQGLFSIAASDYKIALDNYSGASDTLVLLTLKLARTYSELHICSPLPNNYLNDATQYLDLSFNYADIAFPAESIEYSSFLSAASDICLNCSDLVQAEKFLKMSESILSNYSYADCRDVKLNTSIIRARFETLSLRYRKAARIYFRTYKEAISCDNQEVANECLLGLCTLSQSYRGLVFEEEWIRKKMVDGFSQSLDNALNSMTGIARDNYLRRTHRALNTLLSTALKYKAGSGSAYDAVLISKTISLSSTIQIREKILKESSDTSIANLYNQINELYASGEHYAEAIEMEKSLADIIKRNNISFYSVADIPTWKDIKKSMGRDDIAMEYFMLDNGNYGVLYLKKNWSRPRIEQISSVFKNRTLFSAAKYENDKNSLDYDIWSAYVWPNKVVRHFPRTDKGRVFFSPQGSFALNGIEYMPFLRDKYAPYNLYCDCFNIIRLSSTAEILKYNPTEEINTSGLFGGADFYYGKPYSLSFNQQSESFVDDEYETKGVKDNVAKQLTPLSGSLVEVHSIDSLMDNSHLFTGKYASETLFNDYANRFDVIHISTHGFFVPAEQSVKHPYYSDLFESDPNLIKDPMFRSGLHLSGSAAAWIYGALPENRRQDGILTAKEISIMDLSNVRMVVLSACDSGLGEIDYDGIYGLHRAFKSAGVKSILMSLRKVDDEATKDFMILFYKYYQETLSNTKALTLTLNELRKDSSKWRHPKYWSAFVLLDP